MISAQNDSRDDGTHASVAAKDADAAPAPCHAARSAAGPKRSGRPEERSDVDGREAQGRRLGRVGGISKSARTWARHGAQRSGGPKVGPNAIREADGAARQPSCYSFFPLESRSGFGSSAAGASW